MKIITAQVNAFRYYIGREENGTFSLQGLVNNATRFTAIEAESFKRSIDNRCPWPLEIEEEFKSLNHKKITFNENQVL